MGNIEPCNYSNAFNSVNMQKSAVIQIQNNIPVVNGKLNFQKQSAFNKIQKGALQYCLMNKIHKDYAPLIARLIAYGHDQYFAVFQNLKEQHRAQLIDHLSQLDVELMDSLYNHLVLQKGQKIQDPLFNTVNMLEPPSVVKLSQTKPEVKIEVRNQGIRLLKRKKVAVMFMISGHSFGHFPKGKALTHLPLQNSPTCLSILMKKLLDNIKTGKDYYSEGSQYQRSSNQRSSNQSTQFNEMPSIPIIFVCNSRNKQNVQKYILSNKCFGFDQKMVRIVSVPQLPIINQRGKYCISENRKTIMWPEGTAKCLQTIFQKRYAIKHFLQYNQVEYLHVIGEQNLKQNPADPYLVGFLHKSNRDIAAKVVESSDFLEIQTRYAKTNNNLICLQPSSFSQIGESILKKCPIALNSIAFKLQFLYSLQQNIEEDLYLAKKYHIRSIVASYYDFQLNKSIRNSKCIAFEKDIRNYIHTSNKIFILQYPKRCYLPINNQRSLQQIAKIYKQTQSSQASLR